MSCSNLPIDNLGAIFRVKTPKGPGAIADGRGFWIMDWDRNDVEATIRRESRTPPGSHVMLVGFTVAKHPVDPKECDTVGELAFLVDLLYEDHVYYNQWFYESEWLERYEKVEIDE